MNNLSVAQAADENISSAVIAQRLDTIAMRVEPRMTADLIKVDQIEACLAEHHIGDGSAKEIDLLSGGTQNILIRVVDAQGSYVIRRPGLSAEPGAARTMERETRVLGALRDTSVPHPRLLASGHDDRLGGAFYVMEEIQGFNLLNGLSSAYFNDASLQKSVGYALIDSLVSLGEVDYRKVGLENFGRPDGFLERQVPQWSARLQSYSNCVEWPGPERLGDASKLCTWLEENRPATFIPGIMHGDFHIGNVMMHESRKGVAAIIDWELATIGDPLIDLGWLLATWPHDGHPPLANLSVANWTAVPNASALIQHYRSQSSRDVAEINWYTVLACFKLGILLEGTNVRAYEGRASVATGRILHGDAVSLFQRASHWIEKPIWVQ